jgi:hypothetical protein
LQRLSQRDCLPENTATASKPVPRAFTVVAELSSIHGKPDAAPDIIYYETQFDSLIWSVTSTVTYLDGTEIHLVSSDGRRRSRSTGCEKT